jgi:signal-transduction protein with cAMP-binding, CBS, and nucleotidyltransferase domain
LRRGAQLLEELFLPKAREVMTSPVITVQSEVSVMDAVEVMVQEEIGSVVVLDDGEPVGILTRRNVMNSVLKANLPLSQTRVKEVMSKPLITVNPGEPITTAVRMMQQLEVTRLVVMEKGQLRGILTQTDIRLKFSRGYHSHRLLVKKFAVDTIAYLAFWSVFAFVIQVLVVGIEWEKFAISSAIGFVLTILLGGPFGRFLDIFRQRFRV